MTRSIWLWDVACFLSACVCLIQTGPVERSVRVLREVYPEIEPEKVERIQPKVCIVGSLVYNVDEVVPSDQPCLSCKCQSPNVHCETKLCALKPGCRAIHKPNKCCPEYQCECVHEGRTYANGERLQTTPGGECKVCYCRGGEVQCAEVSCYIRTDCEARQVPGQCCPKYEHCPPIESTSDKIPVKPETQENKTKPESTVPPTSDLFLNSSAENEVFETTTLENASTAKPPRKPVITQAITESDVSEKADKSTQTEDVQNDEPPKITIHEIIPEIKEIPIPKSTPNGQQTKNAAAVNQSNDVVDSELESSEVSEVFQIPPVLRIGDQLLFLRKGELVPEKDASTPSPVFTIIGAEGLQRGDVESLEHHESNKEHAEIETTTVLVEAPKEQREMKNVDVAEIKGLEATPTREVTSEKQNTSDVPDASTEVNIVQEQITTESVKLQTSTESAPIENSTIDVAVELATVVDVGTNITKTVSVDKISSTTNNPINLATKLEGEEVKIKIDESIPLENPAYPPIPDIMSEQGTEYVEIDPKEEHTQKSDTKILPEILEIRNNHTIPPNMTNSSWLKNADSNLAPNENDTIPEFVIKLTIETTTVDYSTTKEINDIELKETNQPTDSFSEEDLLRFGTVIESDPLAQNHIKKLAEDGDVSGILTQPTDLSEIKTHSTETLESASIEESGENTTPKTSKHAMLSNEDASVVYGEDTSEATSSESIEKTSKPEIKDVEMLGHSFLKTDALVQNRSVDNATHEEKSDRVEKRTVSYDAESEKIFQELDTEIQLMNDGYMDGKNEEEKKKEAEDIFKELLDEVNSSSTLQTPKETPENPHVRQQSVVLKRVSDAIAKFQAKEDRHTLGSNILGILKEFFNSQSYK